MKPEKSGFPMYLNLYSEGKGIKGIEDKDEKNNANVMTDHYVTITGIVKDGESGNEWLRIQTWGEQYYILYNDFVEYNKINNNLSDGTVIILK